MREAPPFAGPRSASVTIAELLRQPSIVARRCIGEDGLEHLVPVWIAVIVVGAATFGAVIGTHRGDLQVLYAGLKLPLVFLATLALSVPAFHGLATALDRAWSFRATVALALAAAARASLVLIAVAPPLWLAVDWGVGYHASAVLSACCYGLAGLAALGLMLRGLGPATGRVTAALTFAAVFLCVGGQSAWLLRPYLGRPADPEVPFLRPMEGGFADAIVTSARSALGIYDVPSSADLRQTWDVPAEAGDASLTRQRRQP
jgi:hypothetical protein